MCPGDKVEFNTNYDLDSSVFQTKGKKHFDCKTREHIVKICLILEYYHINYRTFFVL